MNINWDADKYTADFSFVHQYGNSVTELLGVDKGGRILDLGCGNGTLTKTLQNKGYLVIGMDASRELLDIAKKNYPDIEFIHGDATDFTLKEPVEGVFSNAVFHWIDKDRQQDMMKCVYDALKEKGEFVFEFGGHGNNQLIHQALSNAFTRRGYSYKMPFYFPTIGEHAALLEETGFKVEYATLFDRMTELKGENGLKDWILLFLKEPFAVINDPEEKAQIIDEGVDSLKEELYKNGKWYADYVRLRMKAVRP